jgi:flagellar P-ring protein precursor FlgI
MRYLTTLTLLFTTVLAGARLKDIAAIEGVRDNQLMGYGLVVGLAGTGDRRQTMFSAQSLTNLLERMGVSVPASAIRVANTAAVLVTATLPPFARIGNKIDVTVSAIGDAPSLQGGILVITSLKGGDGQVYAVSQGALVIGGYSAGRLGTSKSVNHPTVGRIPNGATVERAVPSSISDAALRWQLRQADFTTAVRIASAINAKYDSPIARADDGGVVSVSVPEQFRGNVAQFIAGIEMLPVIPDQNARVVVNERTGTVTIGRDITLAPVSVMHGALSVEVQTSYNVSQPQPFAQGTTEIVPQVSVNINEERAKTLVLPQGATVENLVRALNSIGATPRDIIAILQNLKSAGALDAELEVL